MMIPTDHPVVMPLPSLGHRRFCDAGLARGHPDSGGAAIMGVPLPHLVLPTRGEARGHRSVLAQNSLLMYPLLFLSLDLSSIWCVLARWWAGTNVFALLWLHSCLVSFDCVSLWTCGSQKGTQHDDPWLCVCVCVVCALPRGVDVDRGRACPHRRDVGAWYTARCQWCRDRLGHNGPASLCVCVCGNRGRRAHNGYPSGSGEVGDDCSVRLYLWCICVVCA